LTTRWLLGQILDKMHVVAKEIHDLARQLCAA